MKTCTSCLRDLPLGDFHKKYRHDVKSRPGRSGRSAPYAICKTCVSDYYRTRLVAETPTQREARLKRGRENWFRSQYGITVGEFENMADIQDGKCASCGRPPMGKGAAATLNVDHDHDSGQVRGLLCNPCNQALGLMKDDPNMILQLLAYAEYATSLKEAA